MNHHAILLRANQPLQYEHSASENEILYERHERLGIDEARNITTKAHRAPRTADMQTMVVATHVITVEAQNALLKLLEEPPKTTRFVFVLPNGVSVLPTLMSRFGTEQVVTEESENTVWPAFVAAAPAERLKQIEAWNKTKDIAWLTAMQQGLQQSVATMTPTKQLALVVSRLGTRGASNKMLLELLALDEALQNT